MIWRIDNSPTLNDPQLRWAKRARAEALRMPPGEVRDRLLRTAEASELAVIEGWLAPLRSQRG